MSMNVNRKKLPWLSLVLLLVTYSILGWLLSALHDHWFVWVIVVVSVLLLAVALSSPWSKIRDVFARLFKTDSRAFFIAVIAALLTVVIICWFHIFAPALVVASAGTLVRLDAQTAGLSERQAFWMLAIISLVGLGLGIVGQTLVMSIPENHHLIPIPENHH